jgi:hypothetical protein
LNALLGGDGAYKKQITNMKDLINNKKEEINQRKLSHTPAPVGKG